MKISNVPSEKSRLISALYNKNVYKKALEKLLYSEEKFSVTWQAVKGHQGGEFLTFEEDEVKEAMISSLKKRIHESNKVILEFSKKEPDMLLEIKAKKMFPEDIYETWLDVEFE